MAQIVDVNATIERAGVGRIAVFTIALCFCMMVSDGFDFTAFAPYVGGLFLSQHMPFQQLMIVAALPCVAAALIGFVLGRLYRRHFDAAPATA